MKKYLKIATLFAFVFCFFTFCIISTSAQDLFALKPASENAAHSGYLLNSSKQETNIKFELHKTGGTDASPEYTIYFFIDETATDKIQTTDMIAGWNGKGTPESRFVSGGKVGSGWNGERSQYQYQAFYSEDIANNQIKTAVIGDGITKLGDGLIFTGMYIETIEAPTSLVIMEGSQLKDCQNLTTWYTRGNEPVEGTLDLTNFTSLPWQSWYSFGGCRSVKHYKFPESVSRAYLVNCAFLYNYALEELTIPEGIYEMCYEAVNGCTSLKTLTIPSTCKKAAAASIKNNSALESVTFLGNTTIVYDANAEDQAGMLAENSANTFYNCPNVKTINAPAGSSVFNAALTFGFFSLIDLKPTDAPIASGYVVDATSCKSDCTTAMDEHPTTNIKWEIYNMGTESSPSYTMYFTIDESITEGDYADNTVLHAYLTGANSGIHGYGWSHGSSSFSFGKLHPWYAGQSEEVQAIVSKLSTIVVGDGITELKGGCFANMSSVTMIELPTSCVRFNGAAFKDCDHLTTVYTVGQKVAPIINLSAFTYFKIWDSYLFGGLHEATEIRFPDDYTVSDSLAWAAFLYCKKLTKVNLPEGLKYFSYDAFSQCYALEELTVPSTVTEISRNAFTNDTKLKTLNILGDTKFNIADGAATKADVIADNDNNTLHGCTALETINAPFNSKAHDFALTYGFKTTHSYDAGASYLEFDPETGTLRASKGSTADGLYELQPDGAGMIKKFMDTYRDQVKHIEIEYFSKIKESGFMFRNYPNLETIHFEHASQRISISSTSGGLFSGNPKLKEVWYGGEENHIENTANLSNAAFVENQGEYPGKYLNGIFNGCTSLENVKLFTQTFIKSYTYEGKVYTVDQPVITATSFNGCTSLKAITVPATMTIEDGAFDTCTALTLIAVLNSDQEDGESRIFPDRDGLTVVTASSSIAAAADNYTSTKIACVGGVVKSEGFSIRYSGYNGLRCIYSFDNEKNATIVSSGVTLKEYGALVVSKDRYDEIGGVRIGKISSGYVTNSAYVKKIPVWQNGKIVNKILETSTDARTDFAVAVVKYDSNYKSEIYTCAYSIYEDSEGNQYIEYVNYGSTNPNYEFVSIYGIATGMTDTLMGYGDFLGEEAVWNIFCQGGVDAVESCKSDIYTFEVALYTSLDKTYFAVRCDSREQMTYYAENHYELYNSFANCFGLSISSVDHMFALLIEDDPKFTPEYVTDTAPTTLRTYLQMEKAYKRDDVDKAQHPQGVTTDGEHFYISYTGLIVKVRISDNVVVGTFKASDELVGLGFHMGDMVYYNGYLYGSIIGWGTYKSYIGVIDVSKFDMDDTNDDDMLYAVYLPGASRTKDDKIDAEFTLSDGSMKYAISGIDGMDYGKIPGGGWIDAEGKEHKDDTTYLIVTLGGGVPSSDSTARDTSYDNDNNIIAAFSFDEIQAKKTLLTANRFASGTVEDEASTIEWKYEMFIYTGACCYGCQAFAIDKDTGDYIMNMYGRPSGSVYPSNGAKAVVIDGSKMLYMGEIEVGQSSSNETAQTRAALYQDADGNYPTGLFMTMKCTCGKCGIENHAEVEYGDTGYAVRLCTSLESTSNGLISLGNDYYYRLTSWGGDAAGWNVSLTLYKLSHYLDAWAYTKVE